MLKQYEKYLDILGMLTIGVAFVVVAWFLFSAQQLRHTLLGHSLFGYEQPVEVVDRPAQYAAITDAPLVLQAAPIEQKDGVCGCPACCKA